MAIKKILFATDFSPTSDKAREMVQFLKTSLNCEVDVVYVHQPGTKPVVSYADTDDVADWVDGHLAGKPESGRSALAEICPALGDGCRDHFLEGKPGERIVAFAEENGSDLIVMGTHGTKGLKRLVVGSVADYVLRHAPCGVMTIKESGFGGSSGK